MPDPKQKPVTLGSSEADRVLGSLRDRLVTNGDHQNVSDPFENRSQKIKFAIKIETPEERSTTLSQLNRTAEKLKTLLNPAPTKEIERKKGTLARLIESAKLDAEKFGETTTEDELDALASSLKKKIEGIIRKFSELETEHIERQERGAQKTKENKGAHKIAPRRVSPENSRGSFENISREVRDLLENLKNMGREDENRSRLYRTIIESVNDQSPQDELREATDKLRPLQEALLDLKSRLKKPKRDVLVSEPPAAAELISKDDFNELYKRHDELRSNLRIYSLLIERSSNTDAKNIDLKEGDTVMNYLNGVFLKGYDESTPTKGLVSQVEELEKVASKWKLAIEKAGIEIKVEVKTEEKLSPQITPTRKGGPTKAVAADFGLRERDFDIKRAAPLDIDDEARAKPSHPSDEDELRRAFQKYKAEKKAGKKTRKDKDTSPKQDDMIPRLDAWIKENKPKTQEELEALKVNLPPGVKFYEEALARWPKTTPLEGASDSRGKNEEAENINFDEAFTNLYKLIDPNYPNTSPDHKHVWFLKNARAGNWSDYAIKGFPPEYRDEALKLYNKEQAHKMRAQTPEPTQEQKEVEPLPKENLRPLPYALQVVVDKANKAPDGIGDTTPQAYIADVIRPKWHAGMMRALDIEAEEGDDPKELLLKLLAYEKKRKAYETQGVPPAKKVIWGETQKMDDLYARMMVEHRAFDQKKREEEKKKKMPMWAREGFKKTFRKLLFAGGIAGVAAAVTLPNEKVYHNQDDTSATLQVESGTTETAVSQKLKAEGGKIAGPLNLQKKYHDWLLEHWEEITDIKTAQSKPTSPNFAWGQSPVPQLQSEPSPLSSGSSLTPPPESNKGFNNGYNPLEPKRGQHSLIQTTYSTMTPQQTVGSFNSGFTSLKPESTAAQTDTGRPAMSPEQTTEKNSKPGVFERVMGALGLLEFRRDESMPAASSTSFEIPSTVATVANAQATFESGQIAGEKLFAYVVEKDGSVWDSVRRILEGNPRVFDYSILGHGTIGNWAERTTNAIMNASELKNRSLVHKGDTVIIERHPDGGFRLHLEETSGSKSGELQK